MKSRVYIETTIISYLTAWRSPQLVMAANQEATRQWWDEEGEHFELFISEAVIDELSGGDAEAAQKRRDAILGIPELEISDEARELAKLLMKKGELPKKASLDALHIAIATVNGMHYLLTWNCRHIANATLQKSLRTLCEDAGYELPVLCTPIELLELPEDD